MNKPPDSLDSEHQTLWSEIKDVRNSQGKMFMWIIPIIMSALGALLALSFNISEKLTEHLESGGKLGAKLDAHVNAIDRDLQDKYERHLPVHEQLEYRVDRLEEKN